MFRRSIVHHVVKGAGNRATAAEQGHIASAQGVHGAGHPVGCEAAGVRRPGGIGGIADGAARDRLQTRAGAVSQQGVAEK